MFFVFHILVIIIYFTQINSISVGEKYEKDRNRVKSSFKDARKNVSSNFSTHKPMFEIIKNLTKSKNPNLKVNVFDRMLSEEMFSIRQHFHVKDLSYTAPGQTFIKLKGYTPTLEVKQKWPVMELLANENTIKNKPNYKAEDEENRSVDYEIDNSRVDIKLSRAGSTKKQHDILKDKVVGLRSLPEDLLHHEDNHPNAELKKCNCIGTNPTTCTHRCTGSTQICTHSKCTSNLHECTRTTLSYSIYSAIYLPYYSYIFENTKKPKHRKTTKHRDYSDLYYDSDENYYYDITKDKKPHKHDEPNNIVISIDYDENTDDAKPQKQDIPFDINKDKSVNNIENNLPYEDKKDKLVNDLEHDLNTYYSDIVVKKCYCSSSPRSYFIKRAVFCLITFITFFNKVLTE